MGFATMLGNRSQLALAATAGPPPRPHAGEGAAAEIDIMSGCTLDTFVNSEECRLVIAGSRSVGELTPAGQLSLVENAVREAGFEPSDIDEVVSGGADGPDTAGEAFAARHGIDVAGFYLDDRPSKSSYSWRVDGRSAGPKRNQEMAGYGTHLVALWDGESAGTRSMIEAARKEMGEERVHVVEVSPPGT